MTGDLNLVNYALNQLREHDDPAAWDAILAVIGEEFTDRYRADSGNKSWFMRIGTCSHWVRPHQSRWTASGGFAWPVGYKGASGWSDGLPDFDWSVILFFDGKWWRQVDKLSGKKQIALRVAVPSRTAKHKQASVHTVWSTSHQPTFYGFRNVDGMWRCVAASDEDWGGRVFGAEVKAG
jgi:hypothetical protein